MGLKNLLINTLTWWNGATVGTRFFTRRKGHKVGEDGQGNVYYQTRDGSRRWVIYNGYAEASRIPPGWHGWMHYRTDTPPVDDGYTPHEWERPHEENPTGSPAAKFPPGSLYHRQPAEVARAPYESWRP